MSVKSQCANSLIGKCSGRVNLGKEDILIALRAHLDSSGKLENDYMTLAAVAASDQIWQKFEADWDKILSNHTPKATYVHMRELAHQHGGFDRKLGWNDENAFGLSNQCLIYMNSLDKKRFKVFYCAIDLKAWRKLQAKNYPLPDPIEMCNWYCSEIILAWYLGSYPEKPNMFRDSIRYFFDQNEYFKGPFEDKWNKEKDRAEKTREWNIWQTIKGVSAVDMKDVPGVQAADIVAWAVNRENTVQYGKKAKYMAHIIRKGLPSSSVTWDEAKIRRYFKPLEIPGVKNKSKRICR
ncbi:MAG TPA: DUF3800 domain-containing protein [Candidatus Saccharimonadales bacterium]|jgi:hypothetical protein|nr:DUF3800 domain-containing protein [Candidatus Saccharimonadales bacterium]